MAIRHVLTADALLQSGLVGLWANRDDIGDSVEFARQLRRRAERSRIDLGETIMDKSLRNVAMIVLDALQDSLGADSMTCYFRNPHSLIYRLFHKSNLSRFQYPELMHGPFTHPKQDVRMTAHQNDGEDEHGILYSDNIAEEFSMEILSGPSFVVRERINHTIRVRIKQPAQGTALADAVSQPEAIVFFNYLSKDKFPSKDEATRIIRTELPVLRECLHKLALQSRLTDSEAWRLGSVMLQIHRRLGDVLGSRADPVLQEVYDLIVHEASELIRPNEGAKNVLCTLSGVTPNNEIRILAHTTTKAPDVSKKGVVDYVGRTGHIYVIDDVREYDKKEKGESRPNYVSFHEDTLSELACPLIIQNKVVGVINVEADRAHAYDDRHILMLFRLAAVAALAVRQGALWRDLRIAVQQKHEFLDVATDEEIFERVATIAREFGYHATIYDYTTGQWLQRSLPSQHGPRPDGFSAWVRAHNCPVAVTDLRLRNDDNVSFTAHRGRMDPYSELVGDWEPIGDECPSKISDELKRLIVPRYGEPAIQTDLGFPIFDEDPGGSLRQVRGVLWVKCTQHFMALLNDDTWCLSLICRTASEALKASRAIRERMHARIEVHERIKREKVAFHFGRRADAVLQLLEKQPAILNAREKDRVIVLNVDIRGSTALARSFAARGQDELYVKLVGEYHEFVRRSVVASDGVFDKTMGDGVHALFNVYRPDVLPAGLGNDFDAKMEEDKQMGAAVRCAFAIFSEFNRTVKSKSQEEMWQIAPPSWLSLGAGLAIGRGCIGTFSHDYSGADFMDFSVIGEVANTAGKYVGLARSDHLCECLEAWVATDPAHRNTVSQVDNIGKWTPLPNSSVESLIRRLQRPWTSILLAHLDFYRIASLPDFEGYIFPWSPCGTELGFLLLKAEQ